MGKVLSGELSCTQTGIVFIYISFSVIVSEINELPVETSKRVADFSSIKSQLSKVLNSNDIPDEITDVVAALESAVNILKCIPTLRQGNCYTSNKYCDVKTKGFTLEIKLTICKSPWSLRIDFKVPKDLKSKIPSWIRPFTFIDVSPVILRLDHRKDDGITQIVHNARIATAGLKLWFIKIKWVKAYFNFELKVRWDCTRPKNDNVKRLGYNTAYNDGKPGNDMNKLYYKLKIGYQVKTKRFPCFCYKCKKCETILHKQGHFAEGPNSCKSGKQSLPVGIWCQNGVASTLIRRHFYVMCSLGPSLSLSNCGHSLYVRIFFV